MKIGVFDSGIGGLSVAQTIEQELPAHEVMFRYDADHFPYSTRTPEEILEFVVPILRLMVMEECEIIVIACNTVSTTLIQQLREMISVPLIAVEPMIKPAAEYTNSKSIIVCATPTTLASKRYADLKNHYATDVVVYEPDCSDWSSLIERDAVDESYIAASLSDGLANGADVIVLGCTHYHWIESLITTIAAGRAVVLQPEAAIVSRLSEVIKQIS